MALPSWASQTVAIIHPGVKASRGSDIPDWDNATTTQVSGCSVQPASTSLTQDGRVQGILDGATAYLPPGTDVREGDRVIFEGLTYTVDGTPRAWKSATGRASNIQVNLRRWSG